MKKKYIIIGIIILAILSIIIPIKVQYKEIKHGEKNGNLDNNEFLSTYTTYEKVYLNMYNMEIWTTSL